MVSFVWFSCTIESPNQDSQNYTSFENSTQTDYVKLNDDLSVKVIHSYADNQLRLVDFELIESDESHPYGYVNLGQQNDENALVDVYVFDIVDDELYMREIISDGSPSAYCNCITPGSGGGSDCKLLELGTTIFCGMPEDGCKLCSLELNDPIFFGQYSSDVSFLALPNNFKLKS